MDPSIGRSVHFVDEKLVHRPAIIINVRDDKSADLIVFQARGHRNVDVVSQDESGKLVSTWHWPERVEEKPAAKK